jgi:murein biosynthesis integral membrane protein MurJ
MQILRTVLAAAASALVATGLVIAPAAVDAADAAATSRPAAPAAAQAGTTSVQLSPSGRGVLGLGDDLSLTMTVTNDTDTALPAGRADLDIIRPVVGTRDILTDWLGDTTPDGYPGEPMDRVAVPEVPAHRSVTIDSISVPFADVRLGTLNPFGARRIAASYAAGSTVAVGRSAFTWNPSVDPAPVDVAVAMPITVPATTAGLLGASTLAADTAVDGTLTQQLDAAEGHSVALAVDPRIIASIRILGDDAPSSATAWLERLENLRNEKFPLSYADADVTGLRQAGLPGIAAPISFDQEIAAAVDADRFPDATASPTPSATSTDQTTDPTPAPADQGATGDTGQTDQGSSSAQTPGDSATSPTDTATPGNDDNGSSTDTGTTDTIPTSASLVSFPWTTDTVAWPVEGTVATDDLPALRDAGYTSTILSSANTSAGGSTTVAAAEQVGSTKALVSDQAMSDLLRDAADASNSRAADSAMSKLRATLATIAVQGTATGPVLLTLDRSWPTDSTQLERALSALEDTSWISPTDFSTVVDASPGSLTLQSSDDGADRLTVLRRLVRSEQALVDFASAVTDPALVTAPARLTTLAAASNAWRADPDGLTEQVGRIAADHQETIGSVGIVNSSDITLLGDRSSLPISVRNRSDWPVTVFLTVTPSNSFLRIEQNAVEVTIQPRSSTRTTFPVQSVANGKVALSMALTSATGARIATPATVEINVQAQWETVITAVAAAAVVAIFGLGIVRNVRRRLRRRNGEPEPEDDDDPNRLLAVQPPGPGEGAPVAAAAEPGTVPAPAPERAPTDIATDRPGGPPPVPGAATAIAAASSGTDTVGGDGDRLEDAIARAGVESSLPSDRDDRGARDDRDDRQHHEEPTISTVPPSAEVDAEQGEGRGLGRASAMLAAGTMISRLLGFAKTFVLAYAIGQANSRAADAFAVSNQLPNNIYALIAGGLLSAVLIPQIVRSMSQNSDGGRAYVNKIVTLGGSVFVVITVIATLLAPVLVRLYSAQSHDGKGFSPATTDLAVAFAFWCLPQILFYAIYSLLGEVLNAKQVFGPFTWAPLINNVIAISGLVVFIAMFGNRTVNSGTDDWTPLKIAVLAGSASLGVLAQAAFLPFFWKRAGLTFRPDFRWRGVGLKSTGTAAGWLFAMILVTQLAGIVQSRVASLGSGDAGNAVLQNAWLLFMLPHSIIAVSIATAYFTRMSHDAERGDLDAVRRNLSLSLRIVGLFTVFSSVALMVVAVPFGRMFSNTFGGAVSIGGVLLAYMPGLVLFSMLFIIQRVFWAMHDHRTPFLMQLVQSGLFVIGALAVTALPGSVIGVAVAACTTLAGSAQTIVALVIVRRRLNGIEGPIVTRSHLQFVIAAIVAGAVGLVVVNFFGAFSADGFAMADFTSAVITVVLGGVVMVAVYFGALVVLRNAEIRSAVELVRNRLGR